MYLIFPSFRYLATLPSGILFIVQKVCQKEVKMKVIVIHKNVKMELFLRCEKFFAL